MRRVLIPVVLLGLSACGPAPGDLVVPEASLAQLSTMDPANLAPEVSSRTTLNTFIAYCENTGGNPGAIRNAVLRDGYFLIGTQASQNLEMYANTDGKPLVATGTQDGSSVCMVMAKDDPGLGDELALYIDARHPTAIPFGEMDFGVDTAKNIWATRDTPPTLYFTLVQTDPALGRIEALVTVTE